MAAVSLPSGPVTALHPETEMVEVEGGRHGVWRGWGMREREGERQRQRGGGGDSEVTVRIIEEGGSIERWDHYLQ